MHLSQTLRTGIYVTTKFQIQDCECAQGELIGTLHNTLIEFSEPTNVFRVIKVCEV